jgi:hypothetical protein
MKRRYALYIYTNTDLMKRKLDALKDDGGTTMRAMVTEWIEKATASPRLQGQLSSFYKKNGAMWKDNGHRQIIRVESDENTLALASSLGFSVCTNGSVSEICQILINYHFEKSQLILPVAELSTETEKLPVHRPKRYDIEDTRVRTTFTMDQESVDLLQQLVAVRQMKSGDLVSDLIVSYASSGDKLKSLIKYPDWNLNYTVQDTEAKRFNLQRPVDSMLDLLCRRTAGGINKSAMIRVLIRFGAKEYGIVP